MDKNNHAINAMEFLIMETPDDLKKLENKSYDEYGHEYSKSALNYFNNNNNHQIYLYDDLYDNFCLDHKEKYLGYCLNCKKNICNICEGHETHEIKNLNQCFLNFKST